MRALGGNHANRLVELWEPVELHCKYGSGKITNTSTAWGEASLSKGAYRLAAAMGKGTPSTL